MNSSSYDIGRLRDAKLLLALVAVVLVPFSGAVGPIQSLYLYEVAIPLIFMYTLADFAIRTSDVRRFMGLPGNLLGLVVGMFIFVVVLNYIRHPLLPSSVVGSAANAGGFKTYYRFACCYLVFLTILYWSRDSRITARLVIRVIATVAVAASVAGILIRFAGVHIPGLASMTWSAVDMKVVGLDVTNPSVRVGVLDQFGQLGLLLTMTGVAFNRRGLWLLFAPFFGFCILLGAGRASMASTVAALSLLPVLNRRYLLGAGIVGLALAAALSIQALHELAPDAQTKRLTDISSLQESSVGRYYIYKYGLKAFARNPVFGTGYGEDVSIGLVREHDQLVSEFIEKQLRTGGHATYIAILKNTGLVGFVPFISIWLYILYKLFPLARGRHGMDPVQRKDAQFTTIMITALLIRMLVEGNGSELHLYLYAGLASIIINEWLMTKSTSNAVAATGASPASVSA